MSEKLRPTYDLDTIKATFCTADSLAITVTATKTAAVLGFGRREIVGVIQTMERSHFYKSMTSHYDHSEWQDVYYVPHEVSDLVLYVKFTANVVTEFLLLSFKEADNGYANLS